MEFRGIEWMRMENCKQIKYISVNVYVYVCTDIFPPSTNCVENDCPFWFSSFICSLTEQFMLAKWMKGKSISILQAVHLNAVGLVLLLFRKRSFENLLVNRYLKWAQIFKWFQTKYSMNHNLQSEFMVKVVSYNFFSTILQIHCTQQSNTGLRSLVYELNAE